MTAKAEKAAAKLVEAAKSGSPGDVKAAKEEFDKAIQLDPPVVPVIPPRS